MFRDTDVLYEELAANLESPVEFYVYNSDSDEVRTYVCHYVIVYLCDGSVHVSQG